MIKYDTQVKHVDIETGELITKRRAEMDYDIVSTEKHYDLKKLTNNGRDEPYGKVIVHLTKLCRPKKQIKLWKNQNT